MSTLPTLYALDQQYDELLALAESGELDEQTLADTLDGLQGTMEEKRLAIGHFMENLKAQSKVIKEAEERMAERRKRYENRREWLERYILENMRKHGITSIECPEWKMTARQNPEKVEIAVGTDLPLDYCRIKESYEPDKKKLKEALKAGEQIDGCRLVRGYRLDVK